MEMKTDVKRRNAEMEVFTSPFETSSETESKLMVSSMPCSPSQGDLDRAVASRNCTLRNLATLWFARFVSSGASLYFQITWSHRPITRLSSSLW